MEIKSLENCDYVMLPRLLEQGVKFKHVERDAFKAELRHIEGHGDFWLLHQQAKPHVVAHIQLAKDENDFDQILGWFIGQQKLHEFILGDFSFISAFAGCDRRNCPCVTQTTSNVRFMPLLTLPDGGMNMEQTLYLLLSWLNDEDKFNERSTNVDPKWLNLE